MRVSSPTSKVSSSGKVIGVVCSMVFFATSWPSTDSTPVPPLPRPGPSGVKPKTIVTVRLRRPGALTWAGYAATAA